MKTLNEKDAHAHDIDRRTFLRAGGVLAATAIAGNTAKATVLVEPSNSAGSKRIVSLELDLNGIHKWDDSNGDTWDPFWADDGRLYSFNCDGRGFGKVHENLAFNRFDGESLTDLVGVQINPMSEYGPANQRGKDHATWKVCGQECIDGVFYSFVSRNVYGNESHDALMRQTAFNSSLIKSMDRGLTWQRTADENYTRPMWPGPKFGAPFFVHYGKNGGNVDRDGASEYVYAASTNGFWNDGDSLILGRARRKALPRLDASDWEYFMGRDGASSGRWSKHIDSATPILERPAKCGQTPICYVHTLGIYLLISWYNPAVLTKWFEPSEMCYDFFQAEHPWGPWSLIRSISDSFLAPGSHMYGPSLCSKFQESNGSEVWLAMFTCGCQFEDKPSGIYKAWTIPVVLRTERLSPFGVRPAASAEVQFSGEWTTIASSPDAHAEVRKSTKEGDSLTTAFVGTGVEYVAQEAEGYGEAAVYLDGKLEQRIRLGTTNFPAVSEVCVFRKFGLRRTRHTLKVVNASVQPITFQYLRIYRY
ncbi:MAG TPA: hypothetical protein VKO18_12445 [Terriglobia bacterium]|nr:hypothetical protein [Terriglobia bacterium]